MSLVMTHTRFQFLETIRVPIAVIGTMMFPALALLFFVVPQEAVAGDPVAATAAAGQLSLFAVVSVCLFQFGAGVAEDRSSAWDPYVRTLPAGVTPRMAGRVLNGVLFALLGMLPVLLVAALLTAASVTPGQLVLGALALVVAALPFLGMGLAIGYSLTVKGAVPVAQVVLSRWPSPVGCSCRPTASPAGSTRSRSCCRPGPAGTSSSRCWSVRTSSRGPSSSSPPGPCWPARWPPGPTGGTRGAASAEPLRLHDPPGPS